MANSTQITVLNSASATATVSTLDGFRDGVGTATLLVGNATASLLNATVTGGLLQSIATSIVSATVTVGTAGAASTQVITVQGIAGMTGITVANATASLLSATVTGTVTALVSGTVPVNVNPQTSGGLLKSSTVCTATNNTTLVKGGAGQLYHYSATNNTATVAYLKFYDATTAIAGSGTPVWRVAIPGSSSGGGGIVEEITNGLVFSNGIAFVTTGGIADADTSVVTAGALLVNVGYK